MVCDCGEMANKIKISLATKHQNIDVYKGRSRQKKQKENLNNEFQILKR